MPGPVTDAEREQVRALHGQGLGRNEIARRLGRSGRTISLIAQDLGLGFDRAATVEATEARKADAAALRAAEMLGALQDARRLRGQLFAPCKAFNFGGRDNSYNETKLDEPTFEMKRAITLAWGTLVEKSVRLAEHDTGDTGAAGLLAAFVDGLRRGEDGGGE